MEIDIHDTDDGNLEVFHAYDFAGKRDLAAVLGDVRQWLDSNPNEIVYLDIEDGTELPEGPTADTSVTLALHASFGDPDAGPTMLFTPAMRQALGRWPSRRELLRSGTRVIVFAHRNDAGDGQFGGPTQFVDPNGHEWYGAGLAFRADGSADPIPSRGNFVQHKVQDLLWALANDPSQLANPNYFLSMQSDGIDPLPPVLFPVFTDILLITTQVIDLLTVLDANRATPVDIRNAARLNVNFLKMDFLFGHDEDAGLGANLALFYGIPYSATTRTDRGRRQPRQGSRARNLELDAGRPCSPAPDLPGPLPGRRLGRDPGPAAGRSHEHDRASGILRRPRGDGARGPGQRPGLRGAGHGVGFGRPPLGVGH